MADVAICIGHHPQAKGAPLTLAEKTIHEYDLWSPFATELARTLDFNAAVIERPNPDPDSDLAHKINRTGADCAIELHFNAAESHAARGTEMLHWATSSDGKRLAHHLHEHTVEALGTRSRGLQGKSEGWPFLSKTSMPAVICEPAFGSNSGDAWRLLTRQSQLMRAYREALTAFLVGDPVV